MAKALYIIPFVFAYGSLLDESWAEVFFDGMVLFLLFASMPLFVEGFYFQKIGWGIRIPIGLAGVGFFMACIGPMTEGYLWLAGSAVVLIAAMQYERNRAAGAGAVQSSGTDP